MRFFQTKGKSAKYVLSIYGPHIEDHIYYHYYNDAKMRFNSLVEERHEKETIISIYDLDKDIRKDFIRF